jgi:hypothetical protein
VTSPVPEGTDEAVEAAALDRARTKAAIHPVLHDLNVRIVGLAGDCHCNLIAEVVLGALAERADDIERAARAAGKDQTDG